MLFIKVKILVHFDICIIRIPKDAERTDRDVYKVYVKVIR